MRLHTWCLLVMVCFLFGFWKGNAELELERTLSEAPKLPPADTGSTGPLHELTEVIENKNLGFELEYYSKGELEAFEKNTKEYVRFRKDKLSSEEKARLLVQCLIRPTDHIYCPLISDHWVEDRVFKTQRRAIKTMDRISTKMGRANILSAIEQNNLGILEKATSREIRGAVRSYRKWDDLKRVASFAVKDSECYSVQYVYSLARKIEEFFPDPEARTLARKLYTVAHDCGSIKNPIAVQSRLRLSLLHIYEKDCDSALPVLEKLIRDPEEAFLSRGLYWQAYCAKQDGDQPLFSVARNRLLKANPLGFHTLALNAGRKNPVLNLLYQNKSYVQFRSQLRPDINRKVLAAEYLIKANEIGYASEVLRKIEREVAMTEPTFQLYVVALAKRAGSVLTQLRLVSNLLRRYPKMIARTTLELLFPMKRFKTLWSHRKRMDPYLVAALIRQESAFNARARSRAGALGLMQLMPATARQHMRVSRRALLRPSVNVKIGVKELSSLLRKYDGDGELSLAAYNAGPRNVDRWLKRYPTENKMLFLDLVPFKETRSYVALIVRNYYWYLNLYAPEALHLERTKGPGRGIASVRPSGPGSGLPMFTLLGSM